MIFAEVGFEFGRNGSRAPKSTGTSGPTTVIRGRSPFRGRKGSKTLEEQANAIMRAARMLRYLLILVELRDPLAEKRVRIRLITMPLGVGLISSGRGDLGVRDGSDSGYGGCVNEGRRGGGGDWAEEVWLGAVEECVREKFWDFVFFI
ncbi:unnamed protein product [Amaranthus hypochondriacus]